MQLSREELLRAYQQMRTIRSFEETVHEEYAAGGIAGTVHLYAGEEASAVGMCMHLGEKDWIVSTHRGHGHCIAKGCDPNAMMKELFGRRDGLCAGKGGSMHIADLSTGMMGANAIVGGGPPLICGAALSAKTLKTGGVAVAFTGDGGANQGTTLESLNLARVWDLPAIFVIEDNGYAESTASSWAIGGDLVRRGEAFGIPSRRVDGHDFFEVWEAAREAVERARDGGGPGLIHCRLDRFFGHYEGDAQTYRAPGEQRTLRAERDCLMAFRQRVIEAALLEPEQLDEIDATVADRMRVAVGEAKQAAPPTAADLLTDVYVAY